MVGLDAPDDLSSTVMTLDPWPRRSAPQSRGDGTCHTNLNALSCRRFAWGGDGVPAARSKEGWSVTRCWLAFPPQATSKGLRSDGTLGTRLRFSGQTRSICGGQATPTARSLSG